MLFYLQWISADSCWTICIWSVCVLLSLSCRFLFVLLLVNWWKGHRGKDTTPCDGVLPGERDSDWLHVESNVSIAELPLCLAKSSQADTGWNRLTLADTGFQRRGVGQRWPASSDVCTWDPDTCLCAFLSPRGFQQLSPHICPSETSRPAGPWHSSHRLLSAVWHVMLCANHSTQCFKMIFNHSTVPAEDTSILLPHKNYVRITLITNYNLTLYSHNGIFCFNI